MKRKTHSNPHISVCTSTKYITGEKEIEEDKNNGRNTRGRKSFFDIWKKHKSPAEVIKKKLFEDNDGGEREEE